jgi:predicted RNA binding protein YcfA (HicA-like mRNA interferase family)
MKLPRDISGVDLAKRLGRIGYEVTRQAGSHLRLSTREHGQHHVTIPNHYPLKVGTLAGILRDVLTGLAKATARQAGELLSADNHFSRKAVALTRRD